MTKEELCSVRELQKKIRTHEQRLEALRMSAKNIVPILDGLPHATEAKSKVEKIALRIVEVERELEELRGQLVQSKSGLADKIMREVEAPEVQTLLILRYVDCCPYKEIARRMRYALRHVFKLHERFLKSGI